MTGQAATPTVLNLVLRKVKMDKGYEYYNCHINSQPNQNPLSFHAPLPPFLAQCGIINEWEMSLTKAIVPHNLLHFPETRGVKLIERFRENGELETKNMQGTLREKSLLEINELFHKAEENHTYYNQSNVLEYVHNPDLATIVNDLNFKLLAAIDEIPPGQPEFVFSMTINSNQQLEITSNRRMIMVLPNTLAAVLGLEHKVITLDNLYCCFELEDSKNGVPEYRFVEEKKYLYREEDERYTLQGGKMNIKLIEAQNLLLHANCISPLLAGNAYGQYLADIPLKRQHDFFSEYSPQHAEYHKVNTNALNHVYFKFFHLDGSNPELYSGEINNRLYMTSNYRTYLSISFRRKIKST